MALPDHPFGDVVPAGSANGNGTSVAISVNLDARCRPMRVEEVRQRKCGLLPTAVFLASSIEAKLPAFRCVDSVEADTLAVDFDCVAVDY